MRLLVQLWILLAVLVLGRQFVKAGDDDLYMEAEGSGDAPTEVDGGTTPDDEDSNGPGEMGSGSDNPEGRSGELTKPEFENTIRIMKIGDKKAVFTQEHNDPNSVESQEVFDTVCSVVSNSLQQNQVATENCVGVSITDGSLVVTTKVTLPAGSTASSTDIQGAIQGSLEGRTLSSGSTSLSVDPSSIVVVPSTPDNNPTDVIVETTDKPVKEEKPVIPVSSKPKEPDNDIFFPTTVGMKPSKDDDKTTEMSNVLGGGDGTGTDSDNDKGNSLGVQDKKDNQNFFDMILGNPLLLAALVGAVVLTLITIILVVMFMIYRVKKKDEGSYSLDEPHRVKDPTTYWKDTKEFYA